MAKNDYWVVVYKTLNYYFQRMKQVYKTLKEIKEWIPGM